MDLLGSRSRFLGYLKPPRAILYIGGNCAAGFEQIVALNNMVNPVLMVLTSILMNMSNFSLKLEFENVLMSMLIENPDITHTHVMAS